MKTSRTMKVSKSLLVVKSILRATFPEYTGRTVQIIEAAPDWYHCQYLGDQTSVRWICAGGVSFAETPSYSGSASVTHKPRHGAILVIHSRYGGHDCGIQIIVPALDDDAILAVCADQLLTGGKHARGLAQGALATHTGLAWGEHDDGHEKPSRLDVHFAALETRVKSTRKAEAQAVSL